MGARVAAELGLKHVVVAPGILPTGEPGAAAADDTSTGRSPVDLLHFGHDRAA